jgi:hypothetical protein
MTDDDVVAVVELGDLNFDRLLAYLRKMMVNYLLKRYYIFMRLKLIKKNLKLVYC